jgi:hypothetical protein
MTRHYPFVAAIATAAVFATVPPANAQQSPCLTTETIQACWDRLVGEIDPEATARQQAEVKQKQDDVKKKTETGLSEVAGLSSSVKDFLPLLDIAGLLGPAQKDDTTGAVAVAFNTRLFTRDRSLQIKAVIETSPKMFADLKKQVPEADRDAVEKQLLAANTDTNNFLVSLSYNVTNRTVGRAFEHHSELLNALVQEAVVRATGMLVQQRADLTRQLVGIIGNASLDNTLWRELPADVQLLGEPVLRQAAQTDAALAAAFEAAIKDSGIYLFGQLVNNQPQVQITATRTVRDPLFGPEVTTARVAVEKGVGNSLNDALKQTFDRRRCATPADCLAALEKFARNATALARIKEGSRFAFYAEAVHTADYNVQYPTVNLAHAIPGGTGLTLGIDYGRLFSVTDEGAADGRVDASIRFEHPSKADAEDRFVASLTVTKKLMGLSIPFGIVYANKPQFLGEVDYGLSANLGVKFNLFNGSK